MIPRLQPYPEYKESGLPWIGKVPTHWAVQRLKSLVENVIEQTNSMMPGDVYLALEHVESWTGRSWPPKITGLFAGQVKRFRRGDVLFGKLRPYLAKVSRILTDGVCAGEFFVLRPRESHLNAAYLENQIRSKPTIDVINSSTFGAKMPRADWQFCGNLSITIPLPDEQAAIVKFLDWANGRLERAIRAKRKIIALLNEQKQAIIHRAVTRGLDPNVKLKPSGIPWLGDIPAHWEVVPLKFLCRQIQNGATPPSSEQHYFENGTVPWFGPSSIGGVSDLGTPVRHLTRAAFDDGKARLIRGPAILIIVIGATAGKMGLLLGEGATNQQITAFGLQEDLIVPQFGIRQLQNSENWLRSTASTATIPILDSNIVNRLPIAFPPIVEQQTILSTLSSQTQPITTALSRREREIALLREYRTRLVADVVTGKLDVREAAKDLPEEASQEPADSGVELPEEEPADEALV